jgi:hypothetical protein
MKKTLLLLLLLNTFYSYSQDLPKNPKKGQCYFKKTNDHDQIGKWEKAPCELLKKKFVELKALQFKLINSGYKNVKANGYINVETVDAYIAYKKNQKKIKREIRRKKEKK